MSDISSSHQIRSNPFLLFLSRNEFVTHVALSLVVFELCIYLNTGSLVPLALTGGMYVIKETGAIVNSDYSLFLNVYKWMMGYLESGEVSLMMARRILWHVGAIPFISTLGPVVGSVLYSMALHMVTFLVFAWQGRRLFGEKAVIWMLWLLSTFPAVGYFGGLPLAVYNIIIPASLAIILLLHGMHNSKNIYSLIAISFGLGLLCLAYDFLPFVAGAAILILLYNRRYAQIPIALLVIAVPLGLWLFYLELAGVSATDNPNTRVVINPFVAWVNYFSYDGFLTSLSFLPSVFWNILLHSSYTYLFILFLVLLGLNLIKSFNMVRLPEVAFFLAIAAVMIVLILTPPIPSEEISGWMLSGQGLVSVARLFVPIFVVYIISSGLYLGALSSVKSNIKYAVYILAIGCIMINGYVSVGMFIGDPGKFTSHRHVEFYSMHNTEWARPRLEVLGRRPLGFTRPIDDLSALKPLSKYAFEYADMVSEADLTLE